MSAMNPSGTLSRPTNTNKKLRIECQVLDSLPADHVVVETQPLLPENRHKFAHMALGRQMVREEDKENAIVSVVDDIDIKMEKLKKENEMLRLEQENQRLRESLCHTHPHNPPPSRHRQSCRPMHPPHRAECHGPPPVHHGHHRDNVMPPPPPRHYPGCNNRRSYPPVHNQMHPCPGHGHYNEEPSNEQFDGCYEDYRGDCHGRH